MLVALAAFQRQMMTRTGGATAGEWLRLDLSTAQIKLLFWLSTVGKQPMNHVARALGIGMPAATSLVDRLVDHGLVTREHSPLDRRVVLVCASAEGLLLGGRLRQISEDHWRRILDYVPDESLPTLRAGIAILTEALRRAAEEGEGGPACLPACPQPAPPASPQADPPAGA